jgi:PIN domain nuclease of toxin-antitoxin system
MAEIVVLASSAVLALLNDEPGAGDVDAVLDRAVIGAANWAEVAARLDEKGLSRDEIEEALSLLPDVRPMTRDQALVSSALRSKPRRLGLSLGDRACLALGIELGAVVMTCDGAWAGIEPGLLGRARVDVLR